MSNTVKYSMFTLTTVATVLTVYLSWAPASPVTSVSNSTQRCEQLLSSAEHQASATQCQAPAAEVTWGNWVKGESRSAQFHFIDLFELLFSSNEKQHKAKDSYNQQTSL